MNQAGISEEKPTLDEVRRRFQDWRATRPKRTSRIPAELWQMAVDQVGPYSLNRVSRLLGVNHTALRERYEATHPFEAGLVSSPETKFVEVSFPERAQRVSGCVLELEGTGDRKLRLTLRDETGSLDVLALAKGLWEMAA